MINEIILNIINNIINSFDIPFCISVNILTYLIIKSITDIKSNICFTTWNKRLVLIIVSIILGLIYYFTGSDYKTIINSIILAPVSWSWIFKPICAKLKLDYNDKIDDN